MKTIEIKEIRVSNLLKCTDFDGYIEVAEIGKERVRCANDSGYSYDMLEGIDLDESWLLKLGFEKDKHHNNYSKTYHSWASWEDAHNLVIRLPDTRRATIEAGQDSEVYIGVLVNEVHQLQNLWYALTGTELTIN